MRWATDVGLRRSGVAAAAITLVFYVAVVQPLSGTYFGELFGARGWVPYVIAWLSAWAGLLLAGKAFLLGPQQRALALDLLPLHWRHGHYEIEKIPGFFAIFGFFAYVAIVTVAKGLRLFVSRPEDYYDDDQ